MPRRRVVITWIGVGALALALPALTTNTYYLYLGASAGILVIVTAGLNVLAGFAGQISLGHAGFYAIGAYTAALATTRLGLHPVIACGCAVALSAMVGAGLGAAALRVSGPYLAMVTIAFGIIVEGILVEWVALTGGPGGVFDIPKAPLAHHYLVVLAAAVLALWMVSNLRRSPWGRALLAVRESDVAAESLGLSAYRVRTTAFTVSAAFAGAGGALFAFLNGYISPDSFTLQTSILFLLTLLFGGMGTTAGPVAGSLVLTLLPEVLTRLADYRLIMYGTLLLVSMYWLPSGVIGALARRTKQSGPAPPASTRDHRPEPVLPRSGHESRGSDLVEVEALNLAFGGVNALAGVSLRIPARGIHGVIGPNGAGKTTLLNVLSGYYPPDGGTVRFGGELTTGLAPHAMARRGIARTFQTAQVFAGLSVLENVTVGVAGPRLGSVMATLCGMPGIRRRDAEVRACARDLLEAMGLGHRAAEPADSLAAGLRRQLEIARALATRPRLLLLDEPAAGLSAAEIEALDAELAKIREGDGPAVVLVEHHMDLVMGVSDSVSVLDDGRVIANGPPEAVRRDPAVIEAYLGSGT